MPKLAKIALAILVLSYLVTMTFRVAISSLSAPNVFFDDSQVEALSQLVAPVGIAYGLVCILSLITDWYLAIGWISRGRDWFLGHSAWVRALSYFAPLVYVGIAIKQLGQAGLAHFAEVSFASAFPAQDWHRIAAVTLASFVWTLLFLVFYLAARHWPRAAKA